MRRFCLIALAALLGAMLMGFGALAEGDEVFTDDEWVEMTEEEWDNLDVTEDEADEDGETEPDESEWTDADELAWDDAEDDSVLWGEIMDEDQALANSPENVLLSAMEVYSWFTMKPLDVDTEQPDSTGTKWRVLDERFNTSESLNNFVRFYFDEEIAIKLINSGMYTEEDGYLYTSEEGREMDENVSDYQIEVVDQNESRITYNVNVQYLNEVEGSSSQVFTYVRDFIDGEWKFTVFPFFW